jgi:hypothetical protein
VPGGSGGGVPGKGGWTGLGFVRFFAGRGLAKSQLNRAPSRVQHHAHQNAVDAEPGMPERASFMLHPPSSRRTDTRARTAGTTLSCPFRLQSPAGLGRAGPMRIGGPVHDTLHTKVLWGHWRQRKRQEARWSALRRGQLGHENCHAAIHLRLCHVIAHQSALLGKRSKR